MKAGRLRHKLELQNKTVVKDNFGGETITWNKIVDVRSSIKYLSGKDGLTADQLFGKNVVQFKFRHPRIDISFTDRIIYDNREFDVIPPVKVPNDIMADVFIIAQERAE